MKGSIVGDKIIEQPLTEEEEKMIDDFFLQENKTITLKKGETLNQG